MFDEQAFHNALNTKYDILGQNAAAAQTSANAAMVGARGQADLAHANAAQVASNAAAAQTSANAAMVGARGQADLAHANAAQVAPNAASQRELQGHQGGYFDKTGQGNLLQGQAALQNAGNQGALYQTGIIPNYQSQTNRTNLETNSEFAPAGNDEFRGAIGGQFGFHAGTADVHRPLTDPELHMIHQHLCMGGMVHAMGGMSQVPGQSTPPAQVGTQASDQVPAMLAPNEAVLNSHAADIIGRDKIAAANAIGNHMAKQQREHAAPAPTGSKATAQTGKAAPGKGMMPPKEKAAPAPAVSHQKLSGGTHQVSHGKSAKTPTKIDPSAALQLLQMARGGAGMPAPVQNATAAPQGNPMPMQPAM